jgi:MYXO-CTERM domain-containing protein
MTSFRLGTAAALAMSQWLFGSPSASAYCRTTTCGSEKSPDCAEPSKCPSGGVGIFWPEGQVSIGVENGSALRGISAETARSILTQSMNTWTSVDCGGRPPSISVAPIELIPQSAGTSAFGRDAAGDSVNAMRFFDAEWPHDPTAIALTTVRYGLETGRIVAADIEANAAEHDLTVVDMGGDFDLQSVLTHEAGHFFGLAHVVDRPATMFAVYSGGGNIDRRSLTDNDRQGICTVYPPNRFDDTSGCSCVIGSSPRKARAWFGLPLLALVLRRRKRARPQPTATPSA